MTQKEAQAKADETARKIVGDYIVSAYGVPSLSIYEKAKGIELVRSIKAALISMYDSGVHDGINEG